MNVASNSPRPAFLCALLLLLCALATYPVAEIGMIDDWSYVQSARIFAQTGRIVYNGWAAMMLGWQLPWGALFVKLFGPSFTAIRASTLVVALLTAFLSHRTFVRAGINSRNATVGTLAFVLSPLFLPLALSFMSDIGALFCVVVCLYACLRALQADSDRAVLAWLAFAALSNAFGGTIRQIAWLGVLAMFPCAVWLLRRRRLVLLIGGLLYACSALFIYAALRWFSRQPYSSPEHFLQGFPNYHQLSHLAVQLVSLLLSGALFLLPVLVAFAPRVSLRNRRAAAFLAVGVLLWMTALVFVVAHYPNTNYLDILLAPFKGNWVNPFGVAQAFWIMGVKPFVLPIHLRFFITFVVVLTLLYFFAFLLTGLRTSEPAQRSAAVSQVVSWRSLLILIVPFTLAYIGLLLPRGIRWELLDRYLLILLPIGEILLLRLYQDRVRQHLPLLSSAVALLLAVYAVAGTHDAFGRFRAQQAAIEELRSAGIPDTSIDGGFEHNAMIEIQSAGHIADFNVFLDHPNRFIQRFDRCEPQFAWFTPAVVPSYTLSFDPAACGGISRFAPVTYRAWLPHRMVSIYVVNTVRTAQANLK